MDCRGFIMRKFSRFCEFVFKRFGVNRCNQRRLTLTSVLKAGQLLERAYGSTSHVQKVKKFEDIGELTPKN